MEKNIVMLAPRKVQNSSALCKYQHHFVIHESLKNIKSNL